MGTFDERKDVFCLYYAYFITFDYINIHLYTIQYIVQEISLVATKS